MPPLVLAIEPDLRQAAIVKRIVREKVLADVTVVDSRDAALEAMRTTVPDVLLLSALLSPRDEDELIAHLRTLEHAEHLQTHTIPQLASSLEHDDEKPSRGLLSAFRRRKGSGSAPAGCDPDLFAEEIRTYLQRASDKKRERRENPSRETAATPASVANTPSPRPDDAAATDSAAPESSWASPFEWRPARTEPRKEKREPAPASAPRGVPAAPVTVTSPEPLVSAPEASVGAASEAVGAAAPETVGAAAPEPVVAADHDPVIASRPEAVVAAAAESIEASRAEPAVAAAGRPDVNSATTPENAAEADSVVVAAPRSVLIPQPRAVLIARAEAATTAAPAAPPRKLPLTRRHAREWWFEGEDSSRTPAAKDSDSEMREVLASLSVPLQIAAIGYAEGCRIRRVRVTAD